MSSGAVVRGPRGGLYRVVNGRRVSVKKGGEKPAERGPEYKSPLDAHHAREKAKFGALVRGNPLAAMRAIGKAHPEGQKGMQDMLARGLAKLLGAGK